MITDHLPGRAYRRRATLWLGHAPVTIEWFPVHRYARQLPFPRAIGSNQLNPNHTKVEGIGELDEPRQFVLEKFQPYSGESYCGEPAWFVDGIPEDADTNLPPCPRCVISSGQVRFKVFVRGAVQGSTIVKIGVNSILVPLGRVRAKVRVTSAIGGGAGVKLLASAKVATGAYSAAYSSAWDSYRFV